MNTATGLLLFLAASFAMVVALIRTPALQFYVGAFVIFLFLGGIIYVWLNTVRQTSRMNNTAQEPRLQAEQQG
jgi:hypothetical protein